MLVGTVTISADRAFEVIEMNRRGEKPDSLSGDDEKVVKTSLDLVEQENINRFDKAKKKKKKKKPSNHQNQSQTKENNEGQQ